MGKHSIKHILTIALILILLAGLAGAGLHLAGMRANADRRYSADRHPYGGENAFSEDSRLPNGASLSDASESSEIQTTEAEEEISLIDSSDYLTVTGTSTVTADGTEVILRGVNLGGWLLQENWMCPVQGDTSASIWTQRDTLETLEERFGAEEAQILLDTYQDNWITENDIETLANLGCNCLRVPFWYGNFMCPEDCSWLSDDPDQNPGFQKLDWIIKEAGKYGIYVILDMHGTPGGQSTDHCAGNSGICLLYSDSSYADRMEELWLAISDRYKDNPIVAAYDIMNEPQIPENVSSEEGVTSVNEIYDRMIRAIRDNGDNHILAVEGIWSIDKLPLPQDSGWSNMIYEVHPYGDFDAGSLASYYRDYSDKYQIPVYIGEYHNVELTEACLEQNLSSTFWTYKGTVSSEDGWVMYCLKNFRSADILRDRYEIILEKWGEGLRTQYCSEEDVLNELSACWSKYLK